MTPSGELSRESSADEAKLQCGLLAALAEVPRDAALEEEEVIAARAVGQQVSREGEREARDARASVRGVDAVVLH